MFPLPPRVEYSFLSSYVTRPNDSCFLSLCDRCVRPTTLRPLHFFVCSVFFCFFLTNCRLVFAGIILSGGVHTIIQVCLCFYATFSDCPMLVSHAISLFTVSHTMIRSILGPQWTMMLKKRDDNNRRNRFQRRPLSS